MTIQVVSQTETLPLSTVVELINNFSAISGFVYPSAINIKISFSLRVISGIWGVELSLRKACPASKLKYVFPLLPKFYDLQGLDMIADKQEREELKNQTIKQKNDVMKFYRDELDKITKDGSLDSPAIIQGLFFSPTDNIPIFTTEEAGGSMLVTENPKYMLKDLPIYVPQFFLVSWSWVNSPGLIKFGKAINENFPIEKLQAMIDK